MNSKQSEKSSDSKDQKKNNKKQKKNQLQHITEGAEDKEDDQENTNDAEGKSESQGSPNGTQNDNGTVKPQQSTDSHSAMVIDNRGFSGYELSKIDKHAQRYPLSDWKLSTISAKKSKRNDGDSMIDHSLPLDVYRMRKQELKSITKSKDEFQNKMDHV